MKLTINDLEALPVMVLRFMANDQEFAPWYIQVTHRQFGTTEAQESEGFLLSADDYGIAVLVDEDGGELPKDDDPRDRIIIGYDWIEEVNVP